MEPVAEKAWTSWRGQQERCANPKHKSYAYYGGKGVEVRYTPREFVGWWLHEMSQRKTKKGQFSVDRIDPMGHYEFGNIRLVLQRDNIIERNQRCAVKPVDVFLAKSGIFVMRCSSLLEAAELTGVKYQQISMECAGKIGSYRKRIQLIFRYAKKETNA